MVFDGGEVNSGQTNHLILAKVWFLFSKHQKFRLFPVVCYSAAQVKGTKILMQLNDILIISSKVGKKVFK